MNLYSIVYIISKYDWMNNIMIITSYLIQSTLISIPIFSRKIGDLIELHEKIETIQSWHLWNHVKMFKSISSTKYPTTKSWATACIRHEHNE